ncbi:MAG: hypothetical protein GSR85_02595 [Desulfurococcales archaeon]|nr:hypothetical protein [Desulfurococcales archaeon]
MWTPIVWDILRLHSDSTPVSEGSGFEWCPCMMGFGFMGGGFMGFLWMLLWLVIIIAVIYAVIVFVRNLGQPRPAPTGYGGVEASDEVARLRREIEELRRELREARSRDREKG